VSRVPSNDTISHLHHDPTGNSTIVTNRDAATSRSSERASSTRSSHRPPRDVARDYARPPLNRHSRSTHRSGSASSRSCHLQGAATLAGRIDGHHRTDPPQHQVIGGSGLNDNSNHIRRHRRPPRTRHDGRRHEPGRDSVRGRPQRSGRLPTAPEHPRRPTRRPRQQERPRAEAYRLFRALMILCAARDSNPEPAD
jgi:hypothetical protein